MEFGEWDIPPMYVVGLLVVCEEDGPSHTIVLALMSADSNPTYLSLNYLSEKSPLKATPL
eukprot:scaffold40988_cov46-Cyclotella_meneghiniana.AAC.4